MILYSDVEGLQGMQPAPRGESGSLLITRLFKIMNCLESSDGRALLAAAGIPGEGIPKKPHVCTLSWG